MVRVGRLAQHLNFVNFGNICKGCTENCCKRFYAVLLPEEEEEFRGVSFTLETSLGPVKCLGTIGRPCPFLGKDGLCTNYERRPFDCRVWPILLYYDFNTGDKVVYLDLDCPAVVDGRVTQDLIDSIVGILKKIDIDIEWLKKFTLAPWPNNLKEITRWK